MSKKASNPTGKFHCAFFIDGSLVINDSWIKEELGAQKYLVYYPPASNASTFVTKAFSKKIINGWEFGEAKIKCTHCKLIKLKNYMILIYFCFQANVLEARHHLKELSESEGETSSGQKTSDDSIIAQLEIVSSNIFNFFNNFFFFNNL